MLSNGMAAKSESFRKRKTGGLNTPAEAAFLTLYDFSFRKCSQVVDVLLVSLYSLSGQGYRYRRAMAGSLRRFKFASSKRLRSIYCYTPKSTLKRATLGFCTVGEWGMPADLSVGPTRAIWDRTSWMVAKE